MLQDLEAQLQCDFNGQTPTIARLQADIELLSQGHQLRSLIELLMEDQRRHEVLIETQQKVIETQRQEMKYPKRSRAAYPPPRWVFGAPETANIEFLMFQGYKILIFGAPGTKILIFGAPGRENIDFWCSRDRKY